MQKNFQKRSYNSKLPLDYLSRAKTRQEIAKLYFKQKNYADTICETEKIVDLSLRAVLLHCKIEISNQHPAQILLANRASLPNFIQTEVEKLAKISKSLRRDRELAFYGSEDLTPSDFYSEDDGREALKNLKFVYKMCRGIL